MLLDPDVAGAAEEDDADDAEEDEVADPVDRDDNSEDFISVTAVVIGTL